MANILADSIADIPHLAAFDAMIASRMSNTEVESVLVYMIDTVSSEALPYLAEQFDVVGYSGYVLATTDAERREIIKQAIELKRYIGTVWAVKQAMIALGYGEAELVEGIDEGSPTIDWAKFTVLADLANDKGLDGETDTKLANLIREYKNVRSHLVGISYRTTVTDMLDQLIDTIYMDFYQPDISDSLGWFARYMDGTYAMDGSIKAVEGNDDIKVTIQ